MHVVNHNHNYIISTRVLHKWLFITNSRIVLQNFLKNIIKNILKFALYIYIYVFMKILLPFKLFNQWEIHIYEFRDEQDIRPTLFLYPVSGPDIIYSIRPLAGIRWTGFLITSICPSSKERYPVPGYPANLISGPSPFA